MRDRQPTAERPARPNPGRDARSGRAAGPGGSGRAAASGSAGKNGASGRPGKSGKPGGAGKAGRAGKPARLGRFGMYGRPGARAGKSGPGGKPQAGRRWTNLRPLIVILAVVVLAAGTWGVVMYSSLLDARTVKVRGTGVLTPDQITEAARVPVGTPLARVDVGAIERRVAAIPRVASVTVERDWPHTVAIRVTERQVAAVMPESGRFAEIDKTGVRFGTVDAAPQGVPVVAADPATADEKLLRGVVDVIGTLPAAVAPKVRAITARTRDDIVLTLDDGVVVMWGGAEDSPRKAQVLAVLMKHKAKVYDVSVPEAPATRNAPL
ncbi:cell division protein FtsQ/DivIB [Yinghuangia soli]|uniref:Cell division protein FtsQ n=1 Tax=Yinghuangia soli TaxID=2908204 RepID=A0AA41Q613_9ACTN|nr:FtsQ-type POTRA domain-containing protein [Yinghuangia soli]MCF2531306.1 FtsQ-type POTRA domain-containing protein [Yinghuangia soli]